MSIEAENLLVAGVETRTGVNRRWSGHRDDCAGVLRHLMGVPSPEELYLGVDCEPTDEAAVLRWLAGALGAPPPRSAPETPGGRGGNKRCRNQRLLASGYAFRYPSFRDGYTALLAEEG